eukprot:tig00021070_g17876.t1
MQRRPKDSIGELLNPVRGIRDAQARKGIKPKDHIKENLTAIRKKEEEKQQEKFEASQPAPAPFKLSRFQKVDSVVAKKVEEMSVKAAESREAGEREFLRAHSRAIDPPSPPPRTAQSDQSDATAQTSIRQRIKPEIPKEPGRLAPRTDKDYIRTNAVEAITKRPPAIADPKEKERIPDAREANPDFARVPEYLIQRRMDMERLREEERLAAEEAAECPPGMIRVTEEERVQMLSVLAENRSSVSKALQAMPFICDTIGLRRKKQDLEKRLGEIDEAIKNFSKPKVFVNVNA